MILRQSQLQQKDGRQPNKVDIGRILLNRHQNLPAKIKSEILRSHKGEQGEVEVIKELKKYGGNHWEYFRNVWLDVYGRFECDLIVVTKVRPYLFEIKNYDGLFTYEDGECTLNGYDIPENCIAQANRSFKKIRQLCQSANLTVDVKGAIIFAGAYNPVEIKSPVPNIDVVEKNRLKQYIEKMVADEQHLQNRAFDANNLIRLFDRYAVGDPFNFKPLNDKDMQQIKTGICCGVCQNFALEFSKKHVKCKCGFQESREEAIIRTICEYGVLTYNRDFTAPQIMHFLDNQPSRSYLFALLEKHFDKIKIGKRIFYVNKMLPYELIYKEFRIELPKTLQLSNDEFLLYLVQSAEHRLPQDERDRIGFHIS